MFPIPEPTRNKKENDIIDLGISYECFCMTQLVDDKRGVEILIMKEYGVKESWTSLFLIQNLQINSWYKFDVPFFVTKTREIVFVRYYYEENEVVYNVRI
ncbi:hypothetical protein AABB24_012448 [Solanum stoloniferum]|uniref:Uncharacterized protein n=1 Tax=Solanum stoloniferum TaxID=62892 RepID=A0ABD2U2Y5_9SOLN